MLHSTLLLETTNAIGFGFCSQFFSKIVRIIRRIIPVANFFSPGNGAARISL